MRAVFILAGAVTLGLAGGYAWSGMSHGAAKHAVTIAKAAPRTMHLAQLEDPVAPADAEWEARAQMPMVRQPQTAVTGANVYYARCSDAWKAGKAPIHRGQPGYREELDGDHDGIACEPIRNS